jgi:excisionase family DNA binding protein
MSTTSQPVRGTFEPPILNNEEAAMTKAAQRCLMAALDHSRAKAIALVDETGDMNGAPVLELPPAALRLIAQVLGAMGEQRPITIVPRDHEFTTVEAAHFLNVSRPFVIKEMEAGRLPHRKVGTHRRIAYEVLAAYRARMRSSQDAALQALTDDAQELGLEE